MKNTLLTTTAIALTSIAGTASAVEVAAGAVNLSINGFFRTTVAFTSSSVDATSTVDHDGLDVLTNSEVHFRPSTTLDNGITIGADIELEGNTAADQIDESSIFAFGDFGRIEIGSVDSAGKKMQIGAPDVSMVYANSTSLTSFADFTFADFTGVTTFADLANDAERIVYFTPRFSGFQLGVSYARDSSQTSGAVNNNESGIKTDFFDIGVNYSGTVGAVDLGFSARYGTSDRADRASAAAVPSKPGDQGTAAVTALAAGSPSVSGVGLSLGFGNFSFGGGYVEVDTDTVLVRNSKAYDIGVSYANGPMSYSLTYVEGENAARAADYSESQIIVAAATYAVSSAFNVGVSLSRYETDAVGTEDDVDGTILALSAQFNF